MEIAIIIGGWYFPKHLYEQVRQVIPPDGVNLEFFTVSHRNPKLTDIKGEMIPRINNRQGLDHYDSELYKEIITYPELEALGYKVDEVENKIGDYFFFNQWAEIYDYKKYHGYIFMHDDNYLLPEFKNILLDVFSNQAEYHKYNYEKRNWVLTKDIKEFDYIANSAVGNRDTARGSFSIWSKRLIEAMGGKFPMDNVKYTREGKTDTPKEHHELDWNIVGTNFQGFIQKSGFHDTSFRLSPYYRISKYMIEAERGLISANRVGLNFLDGLKKFT